MEDFVYRNNGRPLSLPINFSNNSPTSPVASCCTCRYLSKSSGNVHQKNPEKSKEKRSTASKRSKLSSWTATPKLTWSVFKSKGKTFVLDLEDLHSKPSSTASSTPSSKINAESKSSWIYFQSQEDKSVKKNKHIKRNSQLFKTKDELLPEKQRSPAITPTYQTAYSIKSSFNPQQQASLFPNMNKQVNSEPHDLRKLLSNKTTSSTQQEDTTAKTDIPRFPGPLDGSLYAQIKKKKSVSKTIRLSASRAYHSADEISSPVQSNETSLGNKKIDLERSASSATDQESRKLPRNLSAYGSRGKGKKSHDNIPHSSSINDNTESGYHVISMDEHRQDENIDCQTSLQEKSTITTEVLNKKSVFEKSSDDTTETCAPTIDTVATSLSTGIKAVEGASEENGKNIKKNDIRNNDSSHSLVESALEATSMQPELIQTNNSPDMKRQLKKELTKEEVQEAVALINECLTDQELRNRTHSITYNDSQRSVSDVVHSNAYKTSPSLTKSQVDNKAPVFSPASPNYVSAEVDRMYAHKSSEYALPLRDVIHKNVQTKTAEIRVQEKSYASPLYPEPPLGNMLDHMLASRNMSKTTEPTIDLNSKVRVLTGSDYISDSVSDPTNGDITRKGFSNSDVDSGIEGSAFNASVKTEVKTSSKEENSLTFSNQSNLQSTQNSRSLSQRTSSTKKDTSSSKNQRDSLEPSRVIQDAGSNPPRATSSPGEDEEEKRVQEEIVNTQKRLAWLQQQQDKLKKQKEEKFKRHSVDLNPGSFYDAQSQAPSWSSTLPRPPGHFMKTELKSETDQGSLSPDQQKDIDELLRSVQNLDFTKTPPKQVMPNTITSASLPTRSQDTETGYKQKLTQNEGVFTPAYAHPMHQPEHMHLHHYQIKKQEESKRNSVDTHWRMRNQGRNVREEKKKVIDMQEKRREEERVKQEQFQIEFEQKQKQLHQEKHFENPTSRLPTIPKANTSKHGTSLAVGSNATVPRPRTQYDNTTNTASVKSDELQSQLDELDHYIALLSQDIDAKPKNNHPILEPSSKEKVVRRRRSFSIEIERKMDPNIPLTPEEDQSLTNKKSAPPKPPSRTRSSFDSVSRRLSHGFELAQLMRQNSIDKEIHPSSKDDDVFEADTFQPSYPPQTRHTRPIQQQIVAAPPPPPAKVTSQKMTDLEKQMSPELFLAMSVNPGARPVEEIHSYKEDLDPASSRLDVVDGTASSTPNFPLSPNTPYSNTLSNSSVQSPSSMTHTPLSALGLKPSINQDPRTANKSQQKSPDYPSRDDDANQRTLHIKTPTLPAKESVFKTESPTANRPFNGNHSNSRLENPTSYPLHHKENISDNSPGADVKSPSHRSHDSGFSDLNHRLTSSNGWIQNSQPPNRNQSTRTLTKDSDLKSPWIHSGESSPHSASTGEKSHGRSFSYLSPSGEVSPSNTSRSLTGSNDSLLSEGSSSTQPHFAYQQQHFITSHVAPSQKDSSQRNSASSTRSSSTGGSGYLGGTSRTSPHSAGSPASSAVGQYPLAQHSRRRESQLSAYDRQGSHPGHHTASTDDGGLSSPTSDGHSSSSTSDVDRIAGESPSSLSGSTPKFIKDTTSYWYKPDITREQALAMLRNRPPGSFVVRDSRCYPGAFGLAIKVHQVPAAIIATAKPGTNMNNELVRHFLIEPSSRGVKLKGCANEPVFGSLSALIYQHSITPLALPCALLIPTENQEVPQILPPGRGTAEVSNTATELLRQGAACNVLYLTSVETESLTGPDAIERSMRECIANKNELKTSIVHFKVSPQGITLTDNARKIFFRRHYPTATVTYCGLDPSYREPRNRRWDASSYRGPSKARVFGFVAKKPGSTVDNVCHLFAELDLDQPAPAIVSFVSKILLGFS